MIDLYFWDTPNGYKILQFLEETGIEYRAIPVNIAAGDQFDPDFLKISPNNKIPAIVDHAPLSGGEPVAIFESGAILLYLAEKTGQLIPADTSLRAEVLQWLFWQVGGLGPMAGQVLHFIHYTDKENPYAINRYVTETARLLGVLDKQLQDKEYLAGTYTIADISIYPWLKIHERIGQDIDKFPNVKSWLERVGQRPATIRSYNKGPELARPRQVA